MKQKCLISVIILLFAGICSAQTKGLKSIYTDFGDENCKELKSDADSGILYRGECVGVGKYKLILLESEHHQSLNLVAPDGKEIDLEMQISVAPSSLGGKAEWRVRKEGKKIIPLALIVRMNVFDEPDNFEKAKSYLIVIKITKSATCVTEVIEPNVVNQNEKAREFADISSGKPCKSFN